VTELETLLRLVETLAALRTEGRLTVRRYAAGWRVGLGHGEVLSQPIHPTLVDALSALLIDQLSVEP
jgi:hypothetical protein